MSWTQKKTKEWVLETRAAQNDPKEEALLLWSHDVERRKFPGERKHAWHCSRSEKARKTKDAMD